LNSIIVKFISSYLVNRKTQYVWNNFSSHFVDVNVGVGQDSVLSPILSALHLAPFLHILEKHLKNLNLQISLLSFVDDGCCGNHLSQRQMIIQAINLLRQISSGNFTRELDKEFLLN